MSWMSLSLLAALLWAVVSVIDKYVISGLEVKPVVVIIVAGIFSFLSAVAIYLIQGYQPLAFGNILLGLLTGALFMLMAYLYFKAVQLGEISRITPLFETSSAMVAIIALFALGEAFTLPVYVGVVLLMMGAMLISSDKPFSFKLGKAFWLMTSAALLLAIQRIIMKYLLGFTDYWTVFSYKGLGSFLVVIPLIWMYLPTLRGTYYRSGLKSYALISLSEITTLSGNLIITIAASVGYVTLVNALASTQSFFVLLLAVLISLFRPQIFKEELDKSVILLKILAIGMIFIGAVLIGS